MRSHHMYELISNFYNFDRFEEYYDYTFPEETQMTNLKILEAAYKWKKQKAAADDSLDSSPPLLIT